MEKLFFAQENCEIRRYRCFFLKPAHTKSGFTIVTFGHILFLLCRHTNFQPTNCTMTFNYVRMMVGLASPLLDLTPAMAATEMAPIRSPGLIIRAKAPFGHRLRGPLLEVLELQRRPKQSHLSLY